MSQTAVCNRHHSLDQQLCRWLLLSLDRLQGSELVMTQELIANMLGVRREGVTEAALKLQKAGVITYARGHITVLDRAKLEELSCECYAVVKSNDALISCYSTVRLFAYFCKIARFASSSSDLSGLSARAQTFTSSRKYL
jgi:hypothetical protein